MRNDGGLQGDDGGAVAQGGDDVRVEGDALMEWEERERGKVDESGWMESAGLRTLISLILTISPAARAASAAADVWAGLRDVEVEGPPPTWAARTARRAWAWRDGWSDAG